MKSAHTPKSASALEPRRHSTAAAPLVELDHGEVWTTSLLVADKFGKRHADVLRAVEKLECSPEFSERNFALTSAEVAQPNGGVRAVPMYRITRDGFTLLAMGFTGKEAMQWKVAYLTAFNQMEAELLARTTRPHNPAIDYDRISPAQAQDLKELVHAIVQANVQGFAETWARLQRKFRVNSYLELPAAQFDEARAYLLAKLPPSRTVPPGKMLVDRAKLASIYIDLGKLQARIDAMGMPAQDTPPHWWQQQSISF